MPSNLAVTSSVFPMLPPVRSQRPGCSAKCLHHVATQGACSSWEFRALAVPFKLIWSEWIWLADANDLDGILCHLSLSPCTCVPTCHLFILHCHTCRTHLQIKIPQASTSHKHILYCLKIYPYVRILNSNLHQMINELNDVQTCCDSVFHNKCVTGCRLPRHVV